MKFLIDHHLPPAEPDKLEAMFNLLKEDEFSFTSFLVQQILVPLVGFASIFVSDIFRIFTIGMPNTTLDNFWATLTAFLLPFCVAMMARRAAPHLSRDGRFVWAAPSSILILALISDSARFGFKRTVGGFFNPQIGEEAWILVLLVIPTCACLAYSFGVSNNFWKHSPAEPRP